MATLARYAGRLGPVRREGRGDLALHRKPTREDIEREREKERGSQFATCVAEHRGGSVYSCTLEGSIAIYHFSVCLAQVVGGCGDSSSVCSF